MPSCRQFWLALERPAVLQRTCRKTGVVPDPALLLRFVAGDAPANRWRMGCGSPSDRFDFLLPGLDGAMSCGWAGASVADATSGELAIEPIECRCPRAKPAP